MLTVKYGPFHPGLEEDFTRFLQELKGEHPLSPVGVITPSRWLLSHLKEVCLRGGTNLFHVSFLTLHALALQILRQGGEAPAPDEEIAFDFLLRKTIETGDWPGYFRQGVKNKGFAEALYQSFRDLKDSGINPDDAIAAVREGYVPGGERVVEIFRIYRAFERKQAEIGLRDFADCYRRAAGLIRRDDYHPGYAALILYGFYDLSGSQLDLVEALPEKFPLHWYFPFNPEDPDYRYAEPFFKLKPVGLAREIVNLNRGTGAGRGGGKKPVLISACGPRDEVFWTAKKILELVDARGYKFEDIAVISRGLELYREAVTAIFPENLIPFSASIGEPVALHPLIRAVMALVTLPAEGFPRGQVLAVLRSPYLRLPTEAPGPEKRPDLWDKWSRALGLVRGLDAWIKGFKLGAEQGEIPVGDEVIEVDREQAGILLGLLRSLQADFEAFPEKAGFADWIGIYRKLVETYLEPGPHFPGGPASSGGDPREEFYARREEAVCRFLETVFSSLAGLIKIGFEVGREEFLKIFLQFLEEGRVPLGIPGYPGRGVQILDAMASRGLRFKVVFLLGANEKNFPRYIQEEPFIRDSTRFKIQETLGVYLPEKLKGFEEEKLLFHFVRESADDQLFILFQRSDESGKALVPSLYLSEISGEFAAPKADFLVPRIKRDKFKVICKKYGYKYLTIKENIIHIMLSNEKPGPGIIDSSPGWENYLETMAGISRARGKGRGLGPADGIIGETPDWWQERNRKGFSPSSLEQYARCPFQFFLDRVLEIEHLPEPETISEIGRDQVGYLYHRILKISYRAGPGKWWERPGWKEFLTGIMRENFTDYAREFSTGFPLVWEIAQEKISRNVLRLVEWDAGRLQDSGMTPRFFEEKVEGFLNLGKPGWEKILFQGVIDRVDEGSGPEGSRRKIIDYKSRARPPASAFPTRILKGRSLQPLIYLLLAPFLPGDRKGAEKPETEFSFIYLEGTGKDGGPREENSLEKGLGKNLEAFFPTLIFLLESIRDGRFFINPNERDQCAYCDYSAVCRKSDPGVRDRREKDQRVRRFEGMGKSESKTN